MAYIEKTGAFCVQYLARKGSSREAAAATEAGATMRAGALVMNTKEDFRAGLEPPRPVGSTGGGSSRDAITIDDHCSAEDSGGGGDRGGGELLRVWLWLIGLPYSSGC
jgi:hypothetical protein